jgi:hypothetical protein
VTVALICALQTIVINLKDKTGVFVSASAVAHFLWVCSNEGPDYARQQPRMPDPTNLVSGPNAAPTSQNTKIAYQSKGS